VEKVFDEFLVALGHHILRSQFLLESLLFKGGLHLVFILYGLSALLLLLGHTLFVAGTTHLAHLFLLFQALLITLKLQLNLVLGTSLGHLSFILGGLALLFLLDLGTLDLQFLSIFGHLQLLGRLTLKCKVEGIFSIRTRI
jgi:hypothetical protein